MGLVELVVGVGVVDESVAVELVGPVALGTFPVAGGCEHAPSEANSSTAETSPTESRAARRVDPVIQAIRGA